MENVEEWKAVLVILEGRFGREEAWNNYLLEHVLNSCLVDTVKEKKKDFGYAVNNHDIWHNTDDSECSEKWGEDE